MTPMKHVDVLIIVTWTIFLICLTLVAGHSISSMVNDHKEALNAGINREGISIDSNETPAHTDVLVGTYINRISRVSMRDSNFDADFYIWFKWKGNDVSPGQDFQIINGKINFKQKQAELHEGDDHYEQYQVMASILMPFDVMLFPFDNHNLTIEMEDGLYSIYELQYVPEIDKDFNLSPKIDVPGYRCKNLYPLVVVHKYETDFGSPWQETIPSTYSQMRFGIGLERTGWGFYFKLFQSLFVAVAVAMLAFFLKPDYAPRFVVGVGALFAAVANYYNILSMQPVVGYLTLADSINLIGILTILLSLIQSSISLHIYDSQAKKHVSRVFDKYSAIAFISCYIIINWWVIVIATH